MSLAARDPEARDRSSSRALVAARLLVPAALALVGYAVLVSERWTIEHELQLVAPDVVRPGDPVPLRAFVFAGIDDPDGGALIPARVDVEIRRGDVVYRPAVTLDPSVTRTSEGTLPPLPVDAPSDLRLEAVARDEDGDVIATVERPIAVDPDAPPAPLRGRIGLPLQQIEAGPLVVEAAGVPVPPLEVRVEGGACVPEEPCELWIDAGDTDVAIETNAALSLAAPIAREGALLRATVVPHGPEATTEVVATRLGSPVARRTVRLPIALATPWVEAPRAVESGPIPVEARPPVGRDALVADLFRDGRWIGTATLDRDTRALPFEVGPGLHRVEVRADVFGGERAAARYVLVGPTPLDRARALLREAGIELTDPEGTDPRLLLAGAEEEVRTLPSAASGLEADRAEVAQRQRTLHLVAGIALGLGIVVLAVSLLRRGLGAAEEAREVMVEAGDPEADSRRARARATIVVVAMVGAVAVALLAGAALILARAALVPT